MIAFALWIVADREFEVKPFVGTAPNLVRELAKITGAKLETDASVANDVIAISAPSTGLTEIREVIAYTLQADWVEVNGMHKLTRNAATLKAHAEIHRDRLSTEFQKYLKGRPESETWTREKASEAALFIAAVDRATRNEDSLPQSYSTAVNKLPISRLLTSLLRCVPETEITGVANGTRKVFSSQPTKLQLPFPKSVQSAVDQFLTENNLLRSTWQADPPGNDALIYFHRPSEIKQIGKVLLSVERSHPRLIRLDAIVLDNEGFEVGSHLDSITLERQAPPDSSIVTKSDAFELSTSTQGKLFWITRPAIPESAWTGYKDYFASPHQSDPLQLLNMDGLNAMANAEGMPVAIALPDMQIESMRSWSAMKKHDLRAYRAILERAHLAPSRYKGWLTFREIDPHLGRMQRIDRRSFQSFVSDVKESGRASLDVLAKFVSRHPQRLEGTYLRHFMQWAGIETPNRNMLESDLGMLRLYAKLTANQKEALKQGTAFRTSDFSSDQQAILRDYLFQRRSINQRWLQSSTKHLFETTEMFPNGLADPFLFTVVFKDVPALFAFEWGRIVPVTPKRVATSLFATERPDLFGEVPKAPILFNDGLERTWEISMRLTPELVSPAWLMDHEIGKDRFRTLGQVSRQIEEEVERLRQGLRTQYKDAKPSDFQKKNPPPPY